MRPLSNGSAVSPAIRQLQVSAFWPYGSDASTCRTTSWSSTSASEGSLDSCASMPRSAQAIRCRQADFFFVLQGGPYPALLLPVKLLTGRRVYQWKTHSYVNRRMAFYARWCDDLVFTATPSSFPLALPNVRVVGHGIDMQQFQPMPDDGPGTGDLIAVGRLTPVKRLDRLISAVAACRGSSGRMWSLDICGPELESDRELSSDARRPSQRASTCRDPFGSWVPPCTTR